MAMHISMNLSLRTRILAAFVFSFTLFLAVMFYTTHGLRSLGDDLRLVNDGYLPLAKVAAQLESYQDRVELDMARQQRDNDRPLAAFRSNTALHARAVSSAIAEGQETARNALASTTNPQEREALKLVLQLLERILSSQSDYVATGQRWVDQARAMTPQEVLAAQADLLHLQKELQTAAKQLTAFLDSRIRRVNERIARSQARVTAVAAGLAGLALTFGIAMLAWTLFTLRPITRLISEVQRVAEGDYARHIDVKGKDEIGVLASEFNAMARNLAERDKRLKERAQQLKRLSRYLRSVLDTIDLGIIVVEEAHVTMANPASSRMWRVEEQAPLPEWLRSLPPGTHPAIPLGRRRFDLQVVPFGSRGLLVLGEDVTQRLVDQERMERNQRLALIGKMLAQICHEIRNPLNAISLNAELLEEELRSLEKTDSTEAMDTLSIISKEIFRLEEVTEHYLDLSRRPALTFHQVDLGDLLRSVVRLERPNLRKEGIRLDLHLPSVPVPITGDGNQLRQAMLNILENARHVGASEIQASLECSDEIATISVRDDGRGMDQETMERAFDPFFSTRSRGTGLGLAITRQILEDHGGHISCTSVPGAGCTIRMVLPLDQEPAEPPTEGV